MRRFALVFLTALALEPGVGAAQDLPTLEPTNVLTWPRAPVDKFGCMLERDFETRHPRFNCSLRNYVNRGDACAATDAYYEGPEFPADKVEKVLPQIDRIEIANEHGQVQAVTLILKRRQTQTAIRALLGLPSSRAALPANISSVDIQGCRPEGASQICNVVLIQGFDHMGAGDVDCGEEGVQPEPTPQPGAAPADDKD
jgi:hypothetical protein